MVFRQVGEHGLATLRDAQPHGASILRVAIANDEATLDEPIHELDDGVMPNA